jgi:hypothetical protein
MAGELKRTFDECQHAHDMLVGLLVGDELDRDPILDDGEQLDPATRMCMRAAADVLCWVLGHGHNTSFAENLEGIEREMQRRGIVLRKLDQPASFGEAMLADFLGGKPQ